MKANSWKIVLGLYLVCLLILIITVVLPRTNPTTRGFTYSIAIILGVMGISLFRYFFRK